MNIRERLKAIVRIIPIVSGLPDCQGRDYWESIKEVFPNILLSTMPIWGGAFVVLILGQMAASDYWAAIIGNVNNGELFLYTTSLLAPIVYMAAVDPPKATQFPSRLSHIVIVIIIMALSALAFGVQKSGHKLDPIFSLRASSFLFMISAGLLFIASVYQNKRLPKITEEDVHAYETTFRDQYRKHRR